jgi:hypothetical protein
VRRNSGHAPVRMTQAMMAAFDPDNNEARSPSSRADRNRLLDALHQFIQGPRLRMATRE